MKRQFITGFISLLAVANFFSPLTASAFGPCKKQFPAGVSYLPSVSQCDGKAAIVLSADLKNSFSVVVRACDNGDRDPCYNYLGERSCGTNASSPFKVQKTIDAIIERQGVQSSAKIHCLKETGSSKVYKMVRRLTIKRVNPVRNPSRDVYKICLPSRTRAFNDITIVSTGNEKLAGNTGFNAACLSQKYLGCDLDAAITRVCAVK